MRICQLNRWQVTCAITLKITLWILVRYSECCGVWLLKVSRNAAHYYLAGNLGIFLDPWRNAIMEHEDLYNLVDGISRSATAPPDVQQQASDVMVLLGGRHWCLHN